MLYSAPRQPEERAMRFFLWCKCAYRNKYTFAGILLVALFLPLNYLVFVSPVLSADPYTGLRIVLICVTGLFFISGLFLISVTGVGGSTLDAYDMAMLVHALDEREFRLRLALSKPPCAEAGWNIAAEQLGYRRDRE